MVVVMVRLVVVMMVTVVVMMIAVPSCGWSRAAHCDCANNG